MFKVNNKDTRTTPFLYPLKLSKNLTVFQGVEELHRSGVFFVNFEHVSRPTLVFGNFEQVNVG